MKRIILDNGDGTVGVMIPNTACGLTVEEIAQKDCGGKPYQIVPTESVPTDRYFRAAWAPGAGKVDVDLVRARGVHMDKIRGARDAKLKVLDIEQLKGNDVAAEKQALRDLPAAVDLSQAQTPDEIKAIWPGELA